MHALWEAHANYIHSFWMSFERQLKIVCEAYGAITLGDSHP